MTDKSKEKKNNKRKNRYNTPPGIADEERTTEKDQSRLLSVSFKAT